MRRNAPLQFSQDVPTQSMLQKTAFSSFWERLVQEEIVEDEVFDEEGLTVQICVLKSNEASGLTAVALLKKILRNLIQNPSEPKVRKLNLTNAKVQEGIVNVPGAMEVLDVCGFKLKEEQLVYEAALTMKLPKNALLLLNRYFPEPKPQSESLQPEPLPIPKRERKTQLVLMKPTVVELPDWFFERATLEIKAEYASMMKKKAQDETLMTRAQRERLKEPTKQFSFATIRVRLPEGVMLQGEFNAEEPAIRIHEWLTEHLRDPTRPFELYLPSRAILGIKRTVKQLELMPAALLSFHWPDGLGMVTEEPTVSDELVAAAVVDWESTSDE